MSNSVLRTKHEQIRRRAQSDVKLPSHLRDITANGLRIKFRSRYSEVIQRFVEATMRKCRR